MTRKQIIIDLLIIFSLSLVVFRWYPGKDFLVAGHDVGYPLNPLNFFKDLFFVWTQRVGLGAERVAGPPAIPIHAVELFFTLLSPSVFWGQRLTFVFWFVLPGLAMYLLASSIAAFRKFRFLPLMASLFYMFNHFQLQGWGVAWRTRFSVYALLPLVFVLIKQCLEGKRGLLPSGFLLALGFSLLNGGGGLGLALFGGLVIAAGVFLIYLTFWAWRKDGLEAIRRSLLLVALTTFLFLVFNLYWLLPFGYSMSASYAETVASVGGTGGALSWIDEISRHASFLNLLRLQGFSSWYDNPQHPYANVFLGNPVLIGLSFLWPLLAFGGILLARRGERKYALFFGLLALLTVVFAAGTHSPSGRLYEFFIKKIPFFLIFRTPFYKFGYDLWFAFALLVSFAVSKIIDKFKGKFVRPILALLFSLLVLFYSLPFFTGRFFDWNLPLTMMVQVPGYVFDFGQWADSLGQDERVLMVPPLNANWRADVYRWHYWSPSILPSLLSRQPVIANTDNLGKREEVLIDTLYDALWKKDEGLAKQLISMLDIKYLLLRRDVFYDLEWCPTTPPDEWQNRLAELGWVKPGPRFNEWQVYEVEKNGFLAHFYAPEKFTFFQGDVRNLIDVIGFEDNPFLSRMYFTQGSPDIVGMKVPENLFVAGLPVKCPLAEKVIELPKVRLLPNSLFYPLIAWKEKSWENKIRGLNDPNQTIDLNLGLASKRLAELERLILVEEGVDEETRQVMAKTAIEEFRARTKEVFSLVEKIKQNGGDIDEILLRLTAYFKEYEGVLNNLRKTGVNTEIRVLLENSVWELNDFLASHGKEQCTNEKWARRYLLDIPQEGDYQLWLKKETTADYFVQDPLNPIVFGLDEKPVVKSNGWPEASWILAGQIRLERGGHKLTLVLPEEKNLIADGSLTLPPGEKGRKVMTFPINNFDDNGLYRISFDYRPSEETKVKFVVNQDTDTMDEKLGEPKPKVDVSLYRNVSPGAFETYFSPDVGARQANLEFIVESNGKEPSFFEIKNIRVEKAWWTPRVVLKMVGSQVQPDRPLTSKTPRINFQEINATQYLVDVKGASEPYILVFSESFNKGWRAKIMDGSRSKPVPETGHLLANGYANAWSISPEDTNGKADYQLMIEFWPQKLFYLGSAISALGLAGCLIGGVWFWLKRRKA